MKDALELAWYCARTKPKHEHIAAANLRCNLGIEVFDPRLRIEKTTRRGLVRSVEPLFPCYIFVRGGTEILNEIRYASGISTIVHFGQQIPIIPDLVIEELRNCFEDDASVSVQDYLIPGCEVSIASGAFRGLQAIVLRSMPARQRVQVLLDILGRQTLVEVDRQSLILDDCNMADMLPSLAAR